ncbi:hypothetical protein ACFE04_022952 [Oxalis oulophora]
MYIKNHIFHSLNHQIRFFSRTPYPNKLSQYLNRAKLIDSFRLALRSNSPKDSISPLLNNRYLDSFVITHALRSAPSVDSAISLVETLKGVPHFTHTQSSIHAFATVLARSKHKVELDCLISDIYDGRHMGVTISFMNLMQWYDAVGDVDLVLNTWDEHRKSLDNKHACTESYNIVMRCLARNGRDSEAVDMFSRLIDDGAIPNSRTYTVMIEHLINSDKIDSAFEIFKILPMMRVKRTLKQFSILMEEFAGVNQFDNMKTLLIEMHDDGKFPGRDMRESLQKLHEAGFIEEANEFLSEMLPDERIGNASYDEENTDEDQDDENHSDVPDVEGVKLKPWLDPKALAGALNRWEPDIVSDLENANFVWTTRLVCKILRNFKSPETAWDFFCWVAYQPGYTHDIHAVERMMAILARIGHVDLVDKLISKMRREGMKLPFSTIRLIIEFYGISKKPDAALKIFHEDKSLCGPISKFNSMILYSSLLRTLTKCGRNSDTLSILEEMILNSVNPDIQTFCGLIYHFALHGDIKTVQQLFTMVRQSGTEPDAYMYKVLIQAFCKCERAALAYRVFEDMSNLNVGPDAVSKDLLVKSLYKEGKRKEAANVEERCQEIANVLPLVLRGHIWTVSSRDLNRVYDIYASSFK